MTASIRSFQDARDFLSGSGTGGGGGVASSVPNPSAPLGITLGSQSGPITRGPSLDSIQQRFNNVQREFNQAVGGPLHLRDFERRDITSAIQRAGRGDDSGRDWVSSLLNRRFEGPLGLDEERSTNLFNQATDKQGVLSSLSQGRGVLSHLQSLSPGLTGGEARLEARNLGGGFFRGASAGARRAGSLAESIQSGIADAARTAIDRQTQAASTRSEVRDLLASQATGIGQVVDERGRNAVLEDDRLARVFADLQRNPLDPDLLRGSGFGGLLDDLRGNPSFQDRSTAEGLQDQLGSFDDLSGFTTQADITGRGTPIRTITDPVSGNAFRIDKLREGLFRSATNRGRPTPGQEFLDALPRLLEREAIASQFGRGGQFSEFNTSQALPGLGSIFGFEAGGIANRENIATQSEDRQADFIASLLGGDSVIGDLTDPRRTAGITADLPGFLSRQDEALGRAQAESDALDAQYQAALNQRRRRYLDGKNPAGQVLGGLGFVPGLQGAWLARALI